MIARVRGPDRGGDRDARKPDSEGEDGGAGAAWCGKPTAMLRIGPVRK
jgi:hypothetical protein